MIDPTPLLAAPQPIPLHAIAALAAAALGAFQLWRPKGTRHHRLVGYVWVALMATVAFSGLFIHVLKMFGLFSPIHLLSIFTLCSLWNAVSQARRGDIAGHRRTGEGGQRVSVDDGLREVEPRVLGAGRRPVGIRRPTPINRRTGICQPQGPNRHPWTRGRRSVSGSVRRPRF